MLSVLCYCDLQGYCMQGWSRVLQAVLPTLHVDCACQLHTQTLFPYSPGVFCGLWHAVKTSGQRMLLYLAMSCASDECACPVTTATLLLSCYVWSTVLFTLQARTGIVF